MKNLRIVISAFIAVACLTACEKKNISTLPEGTADVTINEDDFEVNSSNVTNLTQYAKRVADLLTADAKSLHKAWEISFKDGPAYAETFKNPGAGKTYTSYTACLQEIVEGCATIANEVGTAKIGDPRDLWEKGNYTEAVYAVESWFSYHSIDDYANNIRSIQNAFNGTRNSTEAANSIASYLRANNPELYTQTKSNINGAIVAIESMAAPFRSHIGNSSVLKAQDACEALEKTLSNNLKPYLAEIQDDEALKQIVVTYVDNVVLPTYAELEDKNLALNSAVRALANNPSNETFEAAANAWMASREPWETSEAFLFGPVSDLGLDPNMDSWPLDVEALKNILKDGNFDAIIWSGEYDEEDETISAAQNVRGFHTLEFLLFKDGKPRTYSK